MNRNEQSGNTDDRKEDRFWKDRGQKEMAWFYAELCTLPAPQREVLLRTLDGAEVKEIARELGIEEKRVNMLKRQAYLQLRKQLGGGFALTLAAWFA